MLLAVRTTGLLATALAVASLLAAAPSAAQSIQRDCMERRIKQEVRDGALIYWLRIRPRPGIACRMNLDIGNAFASILGIQVTAKPKHGRLLAVKPNRIVFQAGEVAVEDGFSYALRVRNRHGEGHINVFVVVQPRA